jgi:hypothetical protein
VRRRGSLIETSALFMQGCNFQYGPALTNPCLSRLPEHLSQHNLVLSALEGLDGKQMWDGHVHLIGTGDSDSGIWVNPHMRSILHPKQYLQFKFYLNAACADAENMNNSFLKHLLTLHKELPQGVRLLLLAFDYSYNENG